MREIVEQESYKGGDGENLDEVEAVCHRYNSTLRDTDVYMANSSTKSSYSGFWVVQV
jgi:hypothetical protein